MTNRLIELAHEQARLHRAGSLNYYDCANCHHPPHTNHHGCVIERVLNQTTTPRRERITYELCGCTDFVERYVTYDEDE